MDLTKQNKPGERVPNMYVVLLQYTVLLLENFAAFAIVANGL